MASKKIQVAQPTHSISTGLVTRNKAKSTTTVPTKSASEHIRMSKTKGTRDNYRPVITLTSLGAKGQNHHGGEKHPSALENSRDKSLYSITDTNSSTNSPCRVRKHDSSSDHSNSGTYSYSVAMPVMTTGTTSIEEQLAEMAKAIAKLTQTIEEKDMQIASLMNKVDVQAQNTVESSQGPTHPPRIASPSEVPHASKSVQIGRQTVESASVASLSVQQLQDMIINTIRAQYGEPSQSTLLYSKPYTKRIDSLRMPVGYQPPKFISFDGKGNPKQHVAHFVETCNNAGTEGDLLVKQFVRSLRGNAFDWYTDLEPECIDSWDHMEREFFNRFYSTRRTVSMMELTNTKQWEDEPVVDYINRWRSLSLDCKDRLFEVSAVEMCIQGMHWGLLYILQGIRPCTFEELATRAHDIELVIKTNVNETMSNEELEDDITGGKSITDEDEESVTSNFVTLLKA